MNKNPYAIALLVGGALTFLTGAVIFAVAMLGDPRLAAVISGEPAPGGGIYGAGWPQVISIPLMVLGVAWLTCWTLVGALRWPPATGAEHTPAQASTRS